MFIGGWTKYKVCFFFHWVNMYSCSVHNKTMLPYMQIIESYISLVYLQRNREVEVRRSRERRVVSCQMQFFKALSQLKLIKLKKKKGNLEFFLIMKSYLFWFAFQHFGNTYLRGMKELRRLELCRFQLNSWFSCFPFI